MRQTKANQAEAERARTVLLEDVHPGDTVYTVLRHVSSSGMMRSISVFVMRDGQPLEMDYFVARLLDDRIDQRWGGLKQGGAGMDMGFNLVYNLSATLFPDGFECTGERCPSNDHSNGDRDHTPHHHKSGGYALRQRWM